MTRVKVCGITRELDRRAAAAAGVDAVGFVVDVPVDTPREIPADRAAELARDTPPFVTTVLVTMTDGDPAAAVDLARRVGTDAIQVHGDVDPGELDAFTEGMPGSVIVATDADRAQRFAGVADALLVDSTGEQGRGGTGETHDWHRTRSLVGDLETPVVLAGGLTPDNVAEAVRTVRPHGVDVASGVEREGGVKDHDAVEAFVRAAREAGGSTVGTTEEQNEERREDEGETSGAATGGILEEASDR